MLDIIIPVYNTHKEYLKQCLESISQQSFERYRVTLVDDGSDEVTAELLDEFCEHYDRVSVIHKTNGGVSSARNAGLAQTTAEYVMFMDADDFLKDNVLEEMMNHVQESEADITCFAGVNYLSDGTEKPRNCALNVYTIEGKDAIEQFQCEFLASLPCGNTKYRDILEYDVVWAKVFHREVLKDVVFSTELWAGEDKLFMYDVIGKSSKISYFPMIVYNYRINELSTVHSFRKDACENTNRFLDLVIRNHDDLLQNALYRRAYYLKTLECLGFLFKYYLQPCNAKKYKWTMADFLKIMKREPYNSIHREIALNEIKKLPRNVAVTLLFLKLHMKRLLYMYKRNRLKKYRYVE